MRARGKFILKEEWYSICSRHKHYDEFCDICQVGRWYNIYLAFGERIIYKLMPSVWRWWVNK